MDDVYEQERQAREMDAAHADRETNYYWCKECHKWASKHIVHKCEGVQNG